MKQRFSRGCKPNEVCEVFPRMPSESTATANFLTQFSFPNWGVCHFSSATRWWASPDANFSSHFPALCFTAAEKIIDVTCPQHKILLSPRWLENWWYHYIPTKHTCKHTLSTYTCSLDGMRDGGRRRSTSGGEGQRKCVKVGKRGKEDRIWRNKWRRNEL